MVAQLATSVVESNIPAELRARPQWVAWKTLPPARQGAKPRKVPVNPKTGRNAATDDPATWGTFEQALRCCAGDHLAGVGYVLAEDDPYCGIDLDSCVDDQGNVEPWAAKIVGDLDSYTEFSASGRGLHVIVRANLPDGGRKAPNIEMYDGFRFFAMTGHLYPGGNPTIEERQAEVEALHAATFARPEKPKPSLAPVVPLTLDDERVLDLIRQARNAEKFERLWSGDTSAYGSQSEADLALVAMLAFYTQDPQQLDRLFRRSRLFRSKWDERRRQTTYGALTIQYALDGLSETYTPPAVAVSAGRRPGKPSEESEESEETPEDDSPTLETWPDPPGEAAYYGLAGDLVRTVEPYTEADPVAILVQTLIGFGNLIGRGPFFIAEKSRHYTNLFAVLVGATAKGRKGSSWAHVVSVLEQIDGEWASTRRMSGLSSGEGLIWAVRDPIQSRELVRERGKPPRYEEVESDPGIADKRLLAFEAEFAATLKAIGRQGNTLSTTIRMAWDDGNLSVMTKNSPARATEAHISIIGHVTRDELLKDMEATETSNGFANRFLWLAVRRSKFLPEGDQAEDIDLGELVARFTQAAEFAAHVAQMKRDAMARDLWHAEYAKLSEGKPGLFGLVTSRAEAQVMRLACVYALLDCCPVVKLPHLEAALALWRYCEASCRWIFGDSLGDQTADTILRALRQSPTGLYRNDIRELFDRRKGREEITRALQLLRRHNLAACEKVETKGRPAELWTACGLRAR